MISTPGVIYVILRDMKFPKSNDIFRQMTSCDIILVWVKIPDLGGILFVSHFVEAALIASDIC